ncbi:MAG: hypothetical protein Unbinned400contig1000_45 [Prokaryotic dsDNA virus sp.]|nr:MAG: hypothetical protein Unbinned400contig1000_45 [Prokaryotic dsDNA virus sp.]|tara:strand:- start:10694 stop:10927 length:234 start_codon:yes stop_codon:yes gene_type:complete
MNQQDFEEFDGILNAILTHCKQNGIKRNKGFAYLIVLTETMRDHVDAEIVTAQIDEWMKERQQENPHTSIKEPPSWT